MVVQKGFFSVITLIAIIAFIVVLIVVAQSFGDAIRTTREEGSNLLDNIFGNVIPGARSKVTGEKQFQAQFNTRQYDARIALLQQDTVVSQTTENTLSAMLDPEKEYRLRLTVNNTLGQTATITSDSFHVPKKEAATIDLTGTHEGERFVFAHDVRVTTIPGSKKIGLQHQEREKVSFPPHVAQHTPLENHVIIDDCATYSKASKPLAVQSVSTSLPCSWNGDADVGGCDIQELSVKQCLYAEPDESTPDDRVHRLDIAGIHSEATLHGRTFNQCQTEDFIPGKDEEYAPFSIHCGEERKKFFTASSSNVFQHALIIPYTDTSLFLQQGGNELSLRLATYSPPHFTSKSSCVTDESRVFAVERGKCEIHYTFEKACPFGYRYSAKEQGCAALDST